MLIKPIILIIQKVILRCNFKIKNQEKNQEIAYFSMEIALESTFPIYSGGLGILAGDTLRSAADMGLPMIAVSLTYKAGYFYQQIGPNGEQIEKEMEWWYAVKVGPYPELSGWMPKPFVAFAWGSMSTINTSLPSR